MNQTQSVQHPAQFDSGAPAKFYPPHAITIPKDAVIEGRISFSGIPDTGNHVKGMQVVIRSGSRTLKVTSDQDGWFHLHVPGEVFGRGLGGAAMEIHPL